MQIMLLHQRVAVQLLELLFLQCLVALAVQHVPASLSKLLQLHLAYTFKRSTLGSLADPTGHLQCSIAFAGTLSAL